MNIVVIGGTQAAIKGTSEEIEELLRKMRAVTVETNGSVTKYVSQKENRIKLAK